MSLDVTSVDESTNTFPDTDFFQETNLPQECKEKDVEVQEKKLSNIQKDVLQRISAETAYRLHTLEPPKTARF